MLSWLIRLIIIRTGIKKIDAIEGSQVESQ